MRADRLLSIMMLLQTRGKLTAQALAEELGVSRRTILRDIDALSYARVPIYADSGHGGGIALDENYRTNLTGLNEAEIRVLFISENMQLMNDIGLGEATKRLRYKLSAALPPEQQSIAEQVRQRIYLDPAWWWQDDIPLPFWSDLQKAVFEDYWIQATYENFNGEVAERLLEPYSLVAKAAQWYLIARRDGAYRLYRVARFHSIQIQNLHFRREDGFDLIKFWHEHLKEFRESIAEYTFTLLIHPDRLGFVQSLMPGRFQITWTDPQNGWKMLRFQVESIDLAKMLIFGLGNQAAIVDPPELREAILRSVQDLQTATEQQDNSK
ncbi:MAG TPA: WYL domain-containing protein [Anaerolineaceae bacterium]|nr:WYL domain-containing protein [Anaerolineaceae bacterium]HPN53840.1 WYL domain-containing protein [Anaerolineaceae bacterium]